MTTTISAEQIKFAHDAFIANYKSFPVALSGIIESPSRSPYSNAGCLPHRSPPKGHPPAAIQWIKLARHTRRNV